MLLIGYVNPSTVLTNNTSDNFSLFGFTCLKLFGLFITCLTCKSFDKLENHIWIKMTLFLYVVDLISVNILCLFNLKAPAQYNRDESHLNSRVSVCFFFPLDLPSHETKYLLTNYKIPVKSQLYNINCALQLHVSTQESHHQAIFRNTFKVYKVTVHKCAQLLCTI